MPDFFRSLRYAVRRLRMSPVFSITAILTLSLGIGGTTAIFTLVDAVMLRSLPVADPAKLFRIGDGENCCVQGGIQDNWGMFSYPLFQRLRQAVPEFEELAAFQAGGARLTIRRAHSNEPAKPLRTEYVSGNYFVTFGIGSFAGRVLTASDDNSGAAPVVVLSHHAWEAAYGSDASIIGKSLAFGVPLAIGAGHLISAQLYGVSSSDPLALLTAAFTLAAAAFIAALIPARRAASISPMDALRNE